LRTGKYTLTDYNFKTPSASLLATESTIYSVGGNASFEIFDYPGEYTTRGDGSAFAKLRMQEDEAGHLVAHGSSVCRAFTSGYKFDLVDHYQDSMNASYVLTEIQHIASVGETYSGSGGGNDNYSNHFTCIPETVPFRPARLTPKPFVQGPQTAVVVGKSSDVGDGDDGGGGDGEEIWVDKYGRVIVLFPWDRAGKCSCRVRVSQDWAGQGWGAITIPRVGQEVIVSFLEGDPDRPIITGRVYNADQTVPYPLPDNQTRSTFKTRSTKYGGTDNYNELRFEDKKGDEQIFLRGEKDFDTRLKNDIREWVGNNRSLIVTQDQMEKAGGDLHSQVTGNTNQKVGQNWSLQVGQNLYEKSGANFAHEAGQVIHLKAGTTVVLEAGTELTLKVGGNFIDINSSGISIVGTMVMINSGGAAGSGCGSSPTSPKDPDEADDGSKGGKMN
jgi:type VI secretion system secreted protein VgrG